MNPISDMHGGRPSAGPRQHRIEGFTLIELIVVLIVIGVLAAVAVPRFLNLGRDARLASLNALTGAIWTTANNVFAACRLDPVCDYGSISQTITVGGRSAAVDYGWLNAGDSLNTNQIDAWIDYSGFTAALDGSGLRTVFTLDGAPDPALCSLTYEEGSFHASRVPTITQATSGC